MTGMSEKKLERRCSDIAKANGWYTRKFSSPSNRGVPDRIFIKDSRVIFIEFKAPGKLPTKLQIHELKEINDHGGHGYWCDSVITFKSILEIHT